MIRCNSCPHRLLRHQTLAALQLPRVPACSLAGVSGKVKAVHTTRRYRHPNQQCDCPGPATVSGQRTGRDVLQLKRTHVVGHHSPRSRPSSPAMSYHPFADRVSHLATNLVPACQSGQAATPPKRITTMQTDTWIDHWRDRRDQYNAALSRENNFPAAPSPRVLRVACSTWLRATGPYGVGPTPDGEPGRPSVHNPTQGIPAYRVLTPVLGSSLE